MSSRASSRRVLSRLLTSGPSGRSSSAAAAVARLDATKMRLPDSSSQALGSVFSARFEPPSQPRWFSSAEGEKKDEQESATPEEDKKDAVREEEEEEAADEDTTPQLSREEELEAEVKDLKDKLFRSLAEQENTRRIALRDVDSAKQFAIKSFAKSLLDVSDNLTRALEAVPEEMRHDKEGQPVLANLYEGIQMTDQGLVKAFESNGLVKYGQVGDVFDPNQHEALYEYPDPEKEAGTVGQVMKPGFLLNKRVLRPAEVGVVKSA